jgi:hypothetical protein
LLIQEHGKRHLRPKVMWRFANYIPPHRFFRRIRLIPPDSHCRQDCQDSQRQDTAAQQQDSIPALRSKKKKQQPCPSDNSEDDNGGQGQVHPMLKRHIVQGNDAGGRGQDQKKTSS